MRERLKYCYVSGGTALVLVFMVYVLMAPAVFKSAAQQGAHFPAAYVPLLRVAESDFGGPLRWYSKVCGAELEFFNEPVTPAYVIAAYASGLFAVFGVSYRVIRRKRSKSRVYEA
jgi:hypothetical protein